MNSLVRIQDGPIYPQDIESAVNEVLRRAMPATCSYVLEGKDAFDVDASNLPDLFVRRLDMRTPEGLRVTFENEHLVLPHPQDGVSFDVRLTVAWDFRPVADGSVVEIRHPALRLAGADEPGLLLGAVRGGQFEPIPCPGNRLDCCPATMAWAEHLRGLLATWDRALVSFTARLGRTDAPILTWTSVLQPMLVRLAEARAALAHDENPERAIRRVRSWVETFDELPVRAGEAGDQHLHFLLSQRPTLSVPTKSQVAAENEAFDIRCRDVETQVKDRVPVVDALLASVGIELKELPDVVYQAGRAYRKTGRAEMRRESVSASAVLYLVPDVAAPAKAVLALLWDLGSADIRLGDVRFLPRSPSAESHGEVYLEALRKSGFHWIAGQPLANAVVETGPSLRLLEAAFYEPFV